MTQVVQHFEYLLLALLEYWNEPRHTLSAAACLLRNALGVPYLPSTLVEEALKRALERTNAAYAHTKERVKTSLSEGALRPSDLLAQFKQIGPQTRRHISAAELLDNTVELIRRWSTPQAKSCSPTDLLSEEDMKVLLQAKSCSPTDLLSEEDMKVLLQAKSSSPTDLLSEEDMKVLLQARSCSPTDLFSEEDMKVLLQAIQRQHPKWGAANTPYSRWLPPEYEDIRGVPRGWDPEHTYYNYTLPPVRLISQTVLYTHNENISLDSSLSHLLVEWGQWIDHDFALTPQSPSTAAFRTGADCTRTCSRDTPCFPIQTNMDKVQGCGPEGCGFADHHGQGAGLWARRLWVLRPPWTRCRAVGQKVVGSQTTMDKVQGCGPEGCGFADHHGQGAGLWARRLWVRRPPWTRCRAVGQKVVGLQTTMVKVQSCGPEGCGFTDHHGQGTGLWARRLWVRRPPWTRCRAVGQKVVGSQTTMDKVQGCGPEGCGFSDHHGQGAGLWARRLWVRRPPWTRCRAVGQKVVGSQTTMDKVQGCGPEGCGFADHNGQGAGLWARRLWVRRPPWTRCEMHTHFRSPQIPLSDPCTGIQSCMPFFPSPQIPLSDPRTGIQSCMPFFPSPQIPLSDPRTGIQSCMPSFPSHQIPLSDPCTGIQSCMPFFPSPQIPLSDPRTGIQSCMPFFPSPQIPLSDPRTGIQSCMPFFPSPQIPLSDPRTGIQSCMPSFPSHQIPLSDPCTGIQSCMPFFPSPQIPLSDPRTGIQSCMPFFPSPQIPLSDPRTGIQSCMPFFPSPQIPLSDPRTGIQSCMPFFPSPQIPLSDPRTGIQSCMPFFPSPQIPLSDPRTGIQSCMPFFPSPQIPLSDPRTGIQSCMPFFRSAPSCVRSEAFTGATPHHHREQLNAITSFVDASMVYGSSSPMAAALRNHSSPLGVLALNDQGRLDPCGPRRGSEANSTGATSASDTSATAPTEQENITSCFQAGDSRANEHLGMIALHTLFLREHNRLVSELHLLNPHWSPDTLYQEARKIMGAVHQILTWEHYLPRVLGETPTSLLMPPYKGYDPEIDPSIANVFSAAAFRFAHVTVQPMVARLGPGYSLAPQHPPLPLHHSLFASWRVVQEGGIDPVLRGLLLSPAKLQMPGQMMVEELTERLFQAQGGMPLDLGALNLQRGRDHGLPGYSSWRGLCGLSVPNTTSDLAGILGNPGLAEKFLLLYGTSQNIDVWVGAISEPPLPGGRVGPLLACLLAKQFRALRDGDRFWWEREAVFTSTQRAQLHTVSLSRIICDNTHITRVPSDPFSRTVSPEDMLACSHPLIPHLNLSAWKEPDTDPSCGPIPRLQSGFSLLCDSVIYYQCGPGYQLIGPSSVTCDPNSYQWSPAPPICHDVDECADQPTPCPQNTDCLNTPGSYMCTDLDLSSPSTVSVISAVIAVVGGVAILFVILTCCRRYFPKKPESINGTDKQNR
uniref:thyroid peroxidase n=1 Tax=Oncorhynchus gorbuscha TaxID=8017 RepID=UPI001EAF4823|nr:thyroid peroxidase [Oncorhynchus gorbuscha]